MTNVKQLIRHQDHLSFYCGFAGPSREATLVKHHDIPGAAGLVPSHSWPNFHSNVLCYWHHTARRYGRLVIWSEHAHLVSAVILASDMCIATRKKHNANSSCKLAGLLFQIPGLLLASLAGVGAANFLKQPASWLHGLASGGEYSSVTCLQHVIWNGLTRMHLCHPILYCYICSCGKC